MSFVFFRDHLQGHDDASGRLCMSGCVRICNLSCLVGCTDRLHLLGLPICLLRLLPSCGPPLRLRHLVPVFIRQQIGPQGLLAGMFVHACSLWICVRAGTLGVATL